jgi:WhiB family transcriptional regulator, redox-sensing transcriptional regulator
VTTPVLSRGLLGQSWGDRDWAVSALCKKHPEVDFFPPDGSGVTAAQRICEKCPVRAECLEYALSNQIEHGVWGAVSERGRRKMIQDRRRGRQALFLG